jgi:O-antigen/teichoic acid export membrane protein
MSRTKRFLDGVFFSYTNQIVVMVVGLWLTPFLLRHLGQHDFGLWLIGLKALSYLTLLDIGVLGLLPREVAFAKGRIARGESSEILRTLIAEVTVIILTQVPLLILASVAAWMMLPAGSAALQKAVALILVVFTLQFPLRIAYAALEGLQELGFLGGLQTVGWAAGLVVNVLMILEGQGLYGLAVGWAVTQAVIVLGSAWKFWRSYPEYVPDRLRAISWSQYWKHLSAGAWVSIGQVATLLRASDLLLVGKVLGPDTVVQYSCTGKLTNIGTNQPLVIMQSAQPALSELRASGDRKHLSKVVGALTQAMLLLSGAVSIVILTVNRGFVQKWVGANQYLGFSLTLVLLVEMILRHWNVTTIYSLFSMGRQRHISTSSIVDGGATALFSWLLILAVGPIGAPIGSILALVFISLPWNLYVLRSELGCSLGELLAPLRRWAFLFAPVFILLGLVGENFVPGSYLLIGLTAVGALTIYGFSQWSVVQRAYWLGHVRSQALAICNRFKSKKEEYVV